MKQLFADPNAGLIGLLFFFTFFTVVLIMVFRPGAKEKLEEHGNIPLNEKKHEKEGEETKE